jgi:hypothetical protein
MNRIAKLLTRISLTAAMLITSLASATGIASAEEGSLGITVTPIPDGDDCYTINFNIQWSDTDTSYLFFMDFGDYDTTEIMPVSQHNLTVSHTYPNQGEFTWTVQVAENGSGVLEDSLSGILTLGPQVSLTSLPFPPLVVVGVDDGLIEFWATASGGTPPYEYQWDVDGNGIDDGVSGETTSFTFSEVGKVQAQVTVVDTCGFSATASLPVVVSDPENACHPTAQKIADGVNTLFPAQSGDLYTCEDVYGIFDNEGEENNIGFGRMWKAYNLALTMEELSWEDILAWHLNESGWGALLQLDRFAGLLEEHSLPDLMALVLSEEFSLGDVRSAVRAATRYEADFEDALARIADGATTGELTQFYKLAADLEVDPAALDVYLAEGLTLVEIKQAAKFAEQAEVDWTEIADARSMADSWGDIKQAYKLATDEISAAQILITGVKEYKESLREEAKTEQAEHKTQQEVQNQDTAEKLAEQFSAEFGEVMNLYNGECQGEWACVRQSLKEQQRTTAAGFSEKDYQNALQISSKYGSTQEEVLAYHQDTCGEDWTCTRAYFRNMYQDNKETGKPGK